MLKYTVVSFVEEDNMHVIPACWLLSAHTCKWPTGSTAIVIKNRIKKCKDIDKWCVKAVRIHYYAKSFKSAEKKLELSLETSSVSDGSSSSSLYFDSPKGKKRKLDTVIQSTPTQFTPIPQTSSFINSLVIKEDPDGCELSSQSLVQQPDASSNNDAFIPKIFHLLVDIKSRVEGLSAQVAENTRKLDLLNKVPATPVFEHKNVPYVLPLSSEEDLYDLENHLANNENANQLRLHLSSRNASSMKQMVLQLMKHVLCRDVAILYNLYGLKGKKKFVDLNLCKIIIGAVKMAFKDTTTSDILKRISAVLVGARDWDGERKNRLSINVTT